MPTQKEKQENLKEYIIEKEKEGVVVLMGFEGLTGMKLDEIVKQPVEGLLYDLNRLPEVIWTFIDDPKWINDYAVYLVIKKLHAENTLGKICTTPRSVIRVLHKYCYKCGHSRDSHK